MFKEIITEAPVYIVALALGITGIYLGRDYFLQRQRRKDAERARIEREATSNEISRW